MVEYIVLRVMPLPSIRWLNKSERKTEPFHKNIGGRHFEFWRWYMQSESINFTHQLTSWKIQIYMQSLHTNTHSRKWTFWVQWMSGTLKQSVSKSSLVVHVWYMGNSPEQKIIYIAEHFSTLGYRVVFVVPSNHLLPEKSKKRLNATTFN